MTTHPSLTELLDRPLDSDRLRARAVELLCPVPDRRSQCLTFIVCDDELRIQQPVVMRDLPDGWGIAELHQAMFTAECILLDIGTTMLIVRGRPHNRVLDEDRLLHQYLLERYRMEPGEQDALLGFYVAGPSSVRRMPDPPALVPV